MSLAIDLTKAIYAKMKALEIAPGEKAFLGVMYSTIPDPDLISELFVPSYCVIMQSINFKYFKDLGELTRQQYLSFMICIGSRIGNPIESPAMLKTISLCNLVEEKLHRNTLGVTGVKDAISLGTEHHPVIGKSNRVNMLSSLDIVNMQYTTIIENLAKE